MATQCGNWGFGDQPSHNGSIAVFLRRWYAIHVVWTAFVLLASSWALGQQASPSPTVEYTPAMQKSNQYLQIEYQRCRQDLIEIWQKVDAAEKRAAELTDQVQKLTEALQAVKEKESAKPAN